MTIIEDVRKFVSLEPDDTSFDGELIPLTIGALGKLSQVGGINDSYITLDTTTELTSVVEAKHISITGFVTMFVNISVRMLFDPPPPSIVPYYQSNLDEYIWRIKNQVEMEENVT